MEIKKPPPPPSSFSSLLLPPLSYQWNHSIPSDCYSYVWFCGVFSKQMVELVPEPFILKTDQILCCP